MGRSSIYIVKECLKTYPVAYATPKNSIFTNRFSDLISMMQEGGLIMKWYSDEMNKVALLREAIDVVGEAKPYTLR